MNIRSIAIFLAAMAVPALAQPTLIQNITIIDVEQGRAIPNQSVLIEGETIAQVAPAAAITIPDDATIIEGEGLYLMPGLFDAHVHLTAGQGAYEPLLIAHGIVAVRDTGAMTEAILDLQRSARAEALVPTIVATGAIIDGDPPVWPFSEVCTSEEEARAAVARLAEAGVNQIKVYQRLKPEVYRAAVAAAHERGLKVTGHIPAGMKLEEAIAARQDCLEHLIGFPGLFSALAAADGARVGRDGPLAMIQGWLAYDSVDQAKLEPVLRELAGISMMQCPTIAVWRGMFAHPDAAANDERLKYIPDAMRSFWSLADEGGAEQRSEMFRAILPSMRDLLRRMHDAGVPMMIGTDLANANIFPGWSVHEEMQTFQEAGIPAADVLRMATLIPARFCGIDDRLGTISAGKEASMILVAGDPLADVASAAQIRAVFLRGRHLDRAALDDLLEQAAQRVLDERPVAGGEAPDLALPGTVVHQGRLKMTFGQWDAGFESFLVTRAADGVRVQVQTQPSGGGPPPALVTIHVDVEGQLVRAHWKQLTARPVEAEYTIEDGRFIGRARQGDKPAEEARALPAHFAISPPAQAANMVVLPALGLKAGERRELRIVGFGVQGWVPEVYDGSVERAEDETLTIDGRPVPVHKYIATTRSVMGEFRTEAWITPEGLLRRSVLTMPFGALAAELVSE